ncbi:MAG: glycosyltransferase [Pseudonocardia sp.]
MRIGIVNFLDHGPGTAEPEPPAVALAEALAALDLRVSVLARRNRPRAPTWLTGRAFELRLISAGPAEPLDEDTAVTYAGEFARGLDREVRRGGYDLLHGVGWLAGLSAQLVGSARKIPVVQTIGGPAAVGARVSASRQRAEHACIRRADHLITRTQAQLEQLVTIGVARRRVTVVPPGILMPDAKDAGSGDGAPARLVVVAPPARAAEAVRALARLPAVELVIVPQPVQDQRPDGLADLAARCGVGDRVRVRRPGTRAERAAVFRSAWAVLCLAPSELVGTEHLEAMALGVPVIAGSEAAAEAVVDGVTGRHLRQVEPHGLAAVLRELLASEPLRQQMGVSAQDRVASRYNWPRIAGETLRVYRRLSPSVTPAESAVRPDLPHAPTVGGPGEPAYR